jgi:hypothetical protein
MRDLISMAHRAERSEVGRTRALSHLVAAIDELRKTHPQFVADVAFVVDELASEGRAGEKPSRQSRCWDLVGIGSTDIVLCQVKTRDWPGATEIEILRGFSAPPNARKLVHRWRGGQRQPDVRQL